MRAECKRKPPCDILCAMCKLEEPMTADRAALVKTMEAAFAHNGGFSGGMSAALDLALEEAAKVASDYQHPNMALFNHQTGIAAAISALKSKP